MKKFFAAATIALMVLGIFLAPTAKADDDRIILLTAKSGEITVIGVGNSDYPGDDVIIEFLVHQKNRGTMGDSFIRHTVVNFGAADSYGIKFLGSGNTSMMQFPNQDILQKFIEKEVKINP